MTSTSTPSSSSHFPPTPPPSPPQFRRRHKSKKNDPFFDLDLPTAPVNPNHGTQETETENAEQQDPLITRILLTPLYMLSFLLSLLYITRTDTLRRTSPQRTSYLHPSTWFSAPPEPYQCPTSSAWGYANAKAQDFDRDLLAESRDQGRNGDGREREKERGEREGGKRWYLHKKIRKVATMEIGDAFAMRGRVMLGLGVVAVLTCAGFVLGLRLVWGWVAFWMLKGWRAGGVR